MVGRTYGGTERMRSKYSDIVPGNFEMAVYAQNAADQFTDPSLMALNSEDAMERYHLQVMKTSTPEIRLPASEDKGISGRKRAHSLITTLYQGGPRGPTEQAYKPEIVQSNRSTYTYAVPSTDPIIAGKTDFVDGVNGKRYYAGGGTYHSGVNGTTVFRVSLPNNPSKKEIGTRMFNINNRIAKYAASAVRVENTSRLVDWIPQRKDRMWESRALDEYRRRLMPRIEAVDNADNVNREKNRCRDGQKVAYRYKYKEYDVDRSLHEVLDNGNKIMTNTISRDPGGMRVGNLIAELTRNGLIDSYIPVSAGLVHADKDDTLDAYSGKRSNPNKNTRSKKSTFDHDLPNGDDKNGEHGKRRESEKIKSEAIRVFSGLDDFKKEILIGGIMDEINKVAPKKVKKRRKDTKNKSSTFDNQLPNEDDEDGKHASVKSSSVSYEDGDRKMINFNIPLLMDQFADKITMERSNKKVAKKSGKGKGLTTDDHDYYTSDDADNDSANHKATTVGDKIVNTSQNVRGLISEIAPEFEMTRGNSSINPNVKVVHKDGKIVWRSEANRTHAIVDRLPGADMDLSIRHNMVNGKGIKRPKLQAGIVLKEQIDFSNNNKKVNKKGKTSKPVRDFDLQQ